MVWRASGSGKLSAGVRAVVAMGLVAIGTAGCERRPDSGPVVVSAIGATPGGAAGELPARLLRDATAQGLVRFDAAGQIEPGLAERWIVMDEGASYIFRLREAYWADGTRVAAPQIVRLLERRLVAGAGNPLAPFLTAVDRIVEMTPQVIEIRLRRPRPDLLKLFAQPELALVRGRGAGGTGPFRIVQGGLEPLLRPAAEPGRADPDARTPQPEDDVRLIGERAARAVARFAQRRSDLVSGGSFVDWPLLAAATLPRGAARLDPAAGLFGLAVVRRSGFLADAANRIAVSQAIDRAALTAAIVPQWEAADRILPAALDSAAPPRVPEWSILSDGERREAARRRVAAWETAGNPPPRLSVALPAGPGATLVHAQLAVALAAIGIVLDRAPEAAADLILVDRVAPYDSARWYFVTACRPCSPEAQGLLTAARDAPTLAERGVRLAEADAAIAADGAFIPLARPLRWSLVAPRLAQWQANARAWHPLNRLRPDPI